jgi:hypothetical protein
MRFRIEHFLFPSITLVRHGSWAIVSREILWVRDSDFTKSSTGAIELRGNARLDILAALRETDQIRAT